MRVQIPELLAPRRKPTALRGPASSSDRSSVNSFKDLMRLHDEAFVTAAYPLLLGRNADPAGADYYIRRLRQGYSRVSVLDQMLRSAEVIADWDNLPGLRSSIERYRASRRLSGWKLALRDPELGRTPAYRRARALENAFGAQRQVLLAAIDQLATRNQVIERLLLDLIENGVAQTTSRRQASTAPEMPQPRARSIEKVCDVPSSYRALLDVLRF